MGVAYNIYNDIYDNKYLVRRRDEEDERDRKEDNRGRNDDRSDDRRESNDNQGYNGYDYNGYNGNDDNGSNGNTQDIGGVAMDQGNPGVAGGSTGVIVATDESAVDVETFTQMQEQQKQQQEDEKTSIFTSNYFKYSVIGVLVLVLLFFIIRFLLKHRKKNDLSTNFNRNYSKARDIIKNPEAESYSYDSRDEINTGELYRIESTDSMGQMFHSDITNEENNKKINNATVNLNPIMTKNISPKITQLTPANLLNNQPKSPQDNDISITSPRSLQNIHLPSSSASSFSSQESKSKSIPKNKRSLTKGSIGSSASLKPQRRSKFVSSRSRSLSSSNYYMSSDFLMTPLITQKIPGLDEAMPPPSEEDFVDYPPTPLPESLDDIPYSDNPDIDSEDTEVITPPMEATKVTEEIQQQPTQFEEQYQEQLQQQQYQEQLQQQYQQQLQQQQYQEQLQQKLQQQYQQQKAVKKLQTKNSPTTIVQPVAIPRQNSQQSSQRQKPKPISPQHQYARPSSPLSPKRQNSQPSSPLSQPSSPLSPRRQNSQSKSPKRQSSQPVSPVSPKHQNASNVTTVSPKHQTSKPVSPVSSKQQISQAIPKRLSTKQPAPPKRQESHPTSPQRKYGEPQQIHVESKVRNSLPPPKPQPRVSSRMESIENTNQRPVVKDKKSLVNVRFEIPQNQEMSFEEEMMASFEKYNSSFNNINSSHLLYTNQQAI